MCFVLLHAWFLGRHLHSYYTCPQIILSVSVRTHPVEFHGIVRGEQMGIHLWELSLLKGTRHYVSGTQQDKINEMIKHVYHFHWSRVFFSTNTKKSVYMIKSKRSSMLFCGKSTRPSWQNDCRLITKCGAPTWGYRVNNIIKIIW